MKTTLLNSLFVLLLTNIRCLSQAIITQEYKIYADLVQRDLRPLAKAIVVGAELVKGQDARDVAAVYINDNQSFIGAPYWKANQIRADSELMGAMRGFATPSPADAVLTGPLPLTVRTWFLTKKEYDTIFRNQDIFTWWPRFYQRFPGADGMVEFSRIAYSKSRNRAVVYRSISRGAKDAAGTLFILERTGKEWKVKYELTLWEA